MGLTRLHAHEVSELAGALRAAGLPTEDLGRAGQQFWRFSTPDGALLGYAGLEVRGREALLRSVVIEAARRGQGHGRSMVEAVAQEAARGGIDRLWLLTLDAADFFTRTGFARADRMSAPPALAETAEFVSLCPISAVCMTRDLVAPGHA